MTIQPLAHNEAGIKEILKQLKSTPRKHLHFVLGVVSDKDVSSMLKLLPKNATYYFCNAKIPRALAAGELQQQAQHFNLKGKVYSSVRNAFSAAKKAARKQDLVFVGGSTFVVAEAL